LTGIFLVFWYFDLSFDRGAYLGTVFMIGIVVNNAILVVGLTPLLITGHPSTRDLWTSLSYTGLSGPAISTVLVLFVTPALYRLIAPGDRQNRA
ncbi:MAG: hypothetical protein OXD39_08345, partial [Gemmatimonadetes bacterium]|nr:hypothetical protein [Gemmatimonadota bacterium]